jgi:hypothetical protein
LGGPQFEACPGKRVSEASNSIIELGMVIYTPVVPAMREVIGKKISVWGWPQAKTQDCT